MSRTTFGFAARMTGGNSRAALAQGLPVGKLIVTSSAIGASLADIRIAGAGDAGHTTAACA
jgi:ABC-type uncharacterized transport system permease subunit